MWGELPLAEHETQVSRQENRNNCCSVVVMSRFASESLTGSVLSQKDLSLRGLQSQIW